MIVPEQIEQLYAAIKTMHLCHRYTPPSVLNELIGGAKAQGIYKTVGTSIQGREIGYVELGNGKNKILAWSQMHGDESTTTRGLIDLFSFLNQNEYHTDIVRSILETHNLRFVFQLNPDGALAYCRENALGFDLNRDANTQFQPESKLLNELVTEFKPDLCINCHDQRSLYSINKGITPPVISFLSPAADKGLSLTPARLKAMEYIISAQSQLQNSGFDKIGRYNESYCDSCFGDYFQSQGIPTLLIEAGHIIGDHQREKSRFVVFLALLGILNNEPKKPLDAKEVVNRYYNIPENQNMLRDIVLKNVRYKGKIVDLGLQNRYVLSQGALKLETYVHDIVAPGAILGYKMQDINDEEILINSHENDFENKLIVRILLKKSGLLIKI